MAYSGTTGKIKKDQAIGIGDVQRALSSGITDLYTLCQHPSINIWAKYKPVRSIYPDWSGAKFGEWSADWQAVRAKCPHYEPEWWRGQDFDCGIELKAYTSLSTMVSEWKGTWNYKKIRLGTDYARLTDFNGYYRHAKNPFTIESNNGLYMDTGQWIEQPNVRCYLPDGGTIDADTLSLADINASVALNGSANNSTTYALSKLYFGIVWKNGTTWYIVTSAATFDVNDTTDGNYGKTQRYIVNFSSSSGTIMLPANTDVPMYPVLCNTKCANPVSSGFGKVIPLPVPKLTINIKPFAYLFTAEVSLTNTSNVVVTTLTISKSMYADATLKLKYTMNNKSATPIQVQIIGVTRLHFSNNLGMMGDELQESNNFAIAEHAYPVGTSTQYSGAVTISNLYDAAYADTGNGAYAQYIDVQCSLVFADGTTQTAAYNGRVKLNWQ